MAVQGFGPFFYRIVKMNYPKMKNTKALFPTKKESNNPMYFFNVIEALPNIYHRDQLLSAFIIACNYFEVEVQTIGDRPSLPVWSKFLKTF